MAATTTTATTANTGKSSVWRIELVFRETVFDGEGRRVSAALREMAANEPTLGNLDVEFRQQYLLEGDALSEAVAARIADELLADAVTQTVRITPGEQPPPAESESAAEIVVMLKPGVMDPAEQSLLRGADHLGYPLAAAHTVRKYVFRPSNNAADGADSGLVRAAVESFARRFLANDVIEDVHAKDRAVTSLQLGGEYAVQRVDVVGFREWPSERLAQLSADAGLALNAAEMEAIQAHFRDIGLDPSDVELETIAQTWSEHCKHKTLTGIIDFTDARATDNGNGDAETVATERIDNLLKSTIARVTNELDRDDFCLSVFVDNAGIIAFDDDFGIAMKVETHNHPSALEPYGGAGTGAGGVIRDIMGTGLGARPIMNTDVFCFGPLDIPHDNVPKGTLHPRRVMRGVISGVRDYGNRMGIPTANGALFFHDRYLGNPLVYCGCVGLIRRDKINKAPQAGDAIVVAGGRTGRDGIGGATFSSVELHSESETVSSGAVQIGNAIEEKRLLDVQLQACDRGLFRAVTDCGAGGLSSAIGEMGENLGAEVDLERVPLKYAGLSYREIWLSEAQERMVYAVPPEKLDELLALFRDEDVQATPIGTFVPTGRLTLRYRSVVVGELAMEFLHHGLPRVPRQAVWNPSPVEPCESVVRESADYTGDLMALLAMPNICSKEAIVRQYDHEVQGMSAIKPFVGMAQDGPSDATVIMPVPGSNRGVVVSNGLNPELGLIDPYDMAANAIDEAVRNALAVGGSREKLAILDNFSWGNCAKPDRLGGLVLAAFACYDIAKAYGTPFISGKDSLNNEYRTADGETIAIPPTLLISAVGIIDDVPRHAITMDFKRAGNAVFLLGITRPEWGGSHLHKSRKKSGGPNVPKVRPNEAIMVFDFLERLRDAGIVAACHDCSEGGLAVALAEMCLASNLGARIELTAVRIDETTAAANGEWPGAERDVTALFAESPSRFVIEVPTARIAEMTTLVHHMPIVPAMVQRLGSVTAEPCLEIHGYDATPRITAAIPDLRRAFQSTLATPMRG